MHRTLLIAFIAALSFLGIADSWYLYQSAVTDTALACEFGKGLDGCNVVAQSAYSNLFGLPLALYGIGFFALILVLSVLMSIAPSRKAALALLAAAIAGALASAAFLFIQFFLIKAVCVYCIASAVIAFLICGLAWKLRKRASSEGAL